MNPKKESPDLNVRRRSDQILQARRRPPRATQPAVDESEPVQPTSISRQTDAAEVAQGAMGAPADTTALDDRGALNEWLRSVEEGLADVHRQLSPIVRDVVTTAEADLLWNLLVAVEESFAEHVFNTEDSVFRRLCNASADSKINSLASKLTVMRELAGRLRTYRFVAQRLDYQTEQGSFALADLLATRRGLSAESYQITRELAALRAEMKGVVADVRKLTGIMS